MSVAAGGIRARIQSLDMLANNLANASTTGFKVDREFYGLFAGEESSSEAPSEMPEVTANWIDFGQGVLQPTGNPLDLAISGPGFFAVQGKNGPLYTRNGSFHVSKDGILVTADGYPVQSRDGGPIQLTASRPVEVAADGTVSQNGVIAGQLRLVEFPDTRQLRKEGSNYFRADAVKQQPAPAARAQVAQGKLEQSNVATAETAVRLVGVLRQFDMLQKAIALAGEMNRKASEEVARVGS